MVRSPALRAWNTEVLVCTAIGWACEAGCHLGVGQGGTRLESELPLEVPSARQPASRPAASEPGWAFPGPADASSTSARLCLPVSPHSASSCAQVALSEHGLLIQKSFEALQWQGHRWSYFKRRFFQTRECLLQLLRAIFEKKVVYRPRFNFPHYFWQNNIFQAQKKSLHV